MKMFDEEVLELHELFDGLVENNLSIKQRLGCSFSWKTRKMLGPNMFCSWICLPV